MKPWNHEGHCASFSSVFFLEAATKNYFRKKLFQNFSKFLGKTPILKRSCSQFNQSIWSFYLYCKMSSLLFNYFHKSLETVTYICRKRKKIGLLLFLMFLVLGWGKNYWVKRPNNWLLMMIFKHASVNIFFIIVRFQR